MLNLKKLQTSTALALTLGMGATGIAPLVMAGKAVATPAPMTLAQLFPNQRTTPNTNSTYNGGQNGGQIAIPAGRSLPAAYTQAEKIVVAPGERLPITLTINNNIRASNFNRSLLIPAGTKVEGEFQPVDQTGTRFVAKNLVFPNNTRVAFNAESDVITRTEEIRRGVSTDALLKGAAIGSGAAAIISGITGNRRITLGKVLIGTGAGALGGLVFGRNRAQVLSVDPKTDLSLRLNDSLALNPY
jgi:hypothetical protein